MKFTLSWLKDHLDTQASVEEICEALTDLGLEVEGVENPAERLKSVYAGKVTHMRSSILMRTVCVSARCRPTRAASRSFVARPMRGRGSLSCSASPVIMCRGSTPR